MRYDREYYAKELLKLKKKTFFYLTAGIGVVEVIEVTSHCFVYQ